MRETISRGERYLVSIHDGAWLAGRAVNIEHPQHKPDTQQRNTLMEGEMLCPKETK